ncbi:hypothetical protein GIV19_24945 [Pseudomonas syringae]|nr:hypothetical protein [Pseudomonas syringae]
MEKDYAVLSKKPIAKRAGAFASDQLNVGDIYTRDDLRNRFQITASSLNNGIFKPAAFDSVWIFVTEHKTADRTQYEDILIDNVLHLEGQLKGGTDYLIEEHIERDLELLVFYRKKKYQYPGAGFCYEGRFSYKTKEGSSPTKFVLHRTSTLPYSLTDIETKLDLQGEFDPVNIVDARERTFTNIVRRQGQTTFRKNLLNAYSGQCAVTGCKIESLLEAAHIVPYLGTSTNVTSNGLLLRTDIHTLFDIGLLWIEPETFRVRLAAELMTSEYQQFEDTPISLPNLPCDAPSKKALRSHFLSLQLVCE